MMYMYYYLYCVLPHFNHVHFADLHSPQQAGNLPFTPTHTESDRQAGW